jgi:ATP-dependent Lon protease
LWNRSSVASRHLRNHLSRAFEKQVAELPDNIKNSMKPHFVDQMDEVLALALESPLPQALTANLAAPQ